MAQKRIPQKVMRPVRQYLQILKADNLPIESAFLFGSFAKGKPNKWSDIDVCIISPRFKDSWQALQYLWSKRLVDTGLTIEPVGFSPRDFSEDSSLTSEIKKTGIRIPVI